MSYQVLARKWRPKTFSELVGQEHVVRALGHALDSGRMHHAYLFTGTRGVGKTTIARIFAKSLNCERGPTSHPCGECAICTAVDAGRFLDLIEIDAASNTGVDDVRELIENAQYAPTRGRYKVYLIDEVHMLSKPAFNALLKTLEEPPEHVKFLLATTDPQKLLVTVLSRCLKFSLKRLLPDQIAQQMRMILAAEGVKFEDEAIVELARGADGSLRDGLSLLDQAIAHGGGELRADDVRAMLGTIAGSEVGALLEALAVGDGKALLAEADRVAALAPDFGGVLDQLAGALHRIQLRQLVPGFAGEGAADDAQMAELAQRIHPEDVQLWYQFALNGRRELPFAPDPRTGFEMALLRMLGFRNDAGGGRSASESKPAAISPGTHEHKHAPSDRHAAPKANAREHGGNASPARANGASLGAGIAAEPEPALHREPLALGADGMPDWEQWIVRAGLGGPVGQLAHHAAPKSLDGSMLTLAIKPEHQPLADSLGEALQRQLGEALGKPLRLRFVSDKAVETPAARVARAQSAEQAAAARAIEEDPLVQQMQREFGARVIPESIRPLNTK
ncbi:MAG TPA: DNA polymerase III subunit gamma/tau [Rhodanobacteraceae bacterium]|nr:DNA polymerase III subunit gamma/tau [Rhodanobacteraceae bacterium]